MHVTGCAFEDHSTHDPSFANVAAADMVIATVTLPGVRSLAEELLAFLAKRVPA